MKNIIALIVGNLLVSSACAGNTESIVMSPLKVDLQNVVETGVVVPVGGITSAGQPDEAAFKVFADNGYVAVVDLRTLVESRGLDEPTVVEELGMDYVSLPIGPDGITFENASKLDRLIGSYDQPVLIHCASANRVGALLALRASQQGADDAAAIQFGMQGGMTGLETTVRGVLAED